MYGWGPDDAKSWRGRASYKYDDAKRGYLDGLARDASKKGPRTYVAPTSPNSKLVTAKKDISSDSADAVILGIDVTGSMSTWPAEIFDRLPLFYQTLAQYREGVEMCFAAIGDAYVDRFPLQVNEFAKGVALEDKIKALCPEGGGGGQISESYELFGYFMLNKCRLPKAKNPFLLIFGDENFYDQVDPAQVKHYTGDDLQKELDAREVWKGLLQKFDMYLLHKPYGGGNQPEVDRDVVEKWGKVLGRQRIIELPSAERAIDIVMGLIAKKWGHYDNFTKSLDARHDDSTLKGSVHMSLRAVPDPSAKSVLTKTPKSKMTKGLDDMVDDK